MKSKKSSVSSSSHVQSVERALILLNMLSEENGPMPLTELSRKVGWPKSTVYGLLSTMRDYHYVDQSPETGQYQLGVRLFELGSQVARGWDVRTVAKPVMQRLHLELGETIQLATEDKGEVLYLEKTDSSQMIRDISETGVRLPMHCSGLGKVLLAHKNASEVRWILSQHGLPAFTSRTITTREGLHEELKLVRAHGYATDDGEVMDGLRSVAVPVRDEEGEVKYALGVSGLKRTIHSENLPRIAETLIQAAEEISVGIGFRTRESGEISLASKTGGTKR